MKCEPPAPKHPFAGRRTTVFGLGRLGGGEGAIRYLAGCGARVTVTDSARAADLAASIAALAQVPISRWRFGGHESRDFTEADFVLVNPAVRLDHPLVAAARAVGSRVTCELELLLRFRPCRLAAVSGTIGKSTTAAMLAEVLRAAGERVWLGGNLGVSLLPHLPRMQPTDWAVVELSSFQLAWLAATRPAPGLQDPPIRPIEVVVLTGLAPHHLAWHGSLEAYAAAKQLLLELQEPDGIVVLPPGDACPSPWRVAARGRVFEPRSPADIPPLAIPGEHVRANAAIAAAAAAAIGCDEAAISAGLARFPGLPHRLEPISGRGNLHYVNDSMATTPLSTAAALAALPGPLWLLAGGFDAGEDFSPLAAAIHSGVRGAALFGQAAARMGEEVRKQRSRLPLHECGSLSEAFAWCRERAEPGDTLLLSPGCASHDQYANYAERAAAFARLAAGLRW